jgi:hypothetical protein
MYVHIRRPSVKYMATENPFQRLLNDGLAFGPDFIVTAQETNRIHLKQFGKTYSDENSETSTTQELKKNVRLFNSLLHCKRRSRNGCSPRPNPAFCLYPFNTKSPHFCPSGTRGTHYCLQRYVTSAHTDIL